MVQSLAEGAKSDNGRLEGTNTVSMWLQTLAVRLRIAIFALLSLEVPFGDAGLGVCVTV